MSTEEEKKPAEEPTLMGPPKAKGLIEKEQEAKLRSKYPGLKATGPSALLQKRFSKGQKYFDSGDYNMAKAKGETKKPMAATEKLLIASRGDAIPTPENLQARKPSLVQSKLAAGMS